MDTDLRARTQGRALIDRAPQHQGGRLQGSGLFAFLSISISWLCGSTDAALLLASLLLKESVVPKALQSPRYVRLAVAGRLAASSFWPPDDDELGGTFLRAIMLRCCKQCRGA